MRMLGFSHLKGIGEEEGRDERVGYGRDARGRVRRST